MFQPCTRLCAAPASPQTLSMRPLARLRRQSFSLVTPAPKSEDRRCSRRSRNSIHAAGSAAGITEDLLGILEGTDRGVRTSASQKERIFNAVEALQNIQGGRPTTGPEVDGTWRLLWSTEKETQFIVKNAGVFGTKTGNIWQVIDTSTRRLQNVITFPPLGSFIVDSSIDPEPDSQRIDFKFDAASLTVNGRKFGVPPFGKGWFESVYLEPESAGGKRIRVAKDIRGDTLIALWDGPPKVFK